MIVVNIASSNPVYVQISYKKYQFSNFRSLLFVRYNIPQASDHKTDDD